MPELPEVETVRSSLTPHLIGQSIDAIEFKRPNLRVPIPTRRLRRWVEGGTVVDVRRRGKYLLIDIDTAYTVLVHLGMSGRLLMADQEVPDAPHLHMRWNLSNRRQLRYYDVRKFGVVDIDATDHLTQSQYLSHLGIEPLAGECRAEDLYRVARRRQQPIKNFLMDSRVLVGIGNIYANESLFEAGIDPRSPASALSKRRWYALVETFQDVLRRAIACGGTTLNDFQDGEGHTGFFQVELFVYGRVGQACKRCTTAIDKCVLAGRSTFYCRKCQKRLAPTKE